MHPRGTQYDDLWLKPTARCVASGTGIAGASLCGVRCPGLQTMVHNSALPVWWQYRILAT